MFPQGFLTSIRSAAGFDEDAFLQAHKAASPPVSIRMNPGKQAAGGEAVSTGLERVAWCNNGFYLPSRPVFTLDPLLHAGAYYVQEASSMFIEQAVKTICKNIEVKSALDLCAAPGGKSTHLLSLLPDEAVVVSNEVIQARTAILLENIIKWGSARSIVTQNDPAGFGKLGPTFDFMLVDAPCSGSGLFRRDAGAMNEWSLQAVELCSQRQQRILADVLPALKAGGFLLYATCSYSPDEDEKIIDWLAANFPFEGMNIDWPDGREGVVCSFSPEKRLPCYRFYPGKVKGEGFFMALLKLEGEDEPFNKKKDKGKTTADSRLPEPLKKWIINPDGVHYYQHKETGFLMPPAVWQAFSQWRTLLNIRKAGVRIAEDAHGKFNPVHDFALSTLLNRDAFEVFEADLSTALAFLRKEDFTLPAGVSKGWVLPVYKGMPLGWLKNMGSRVNNYYPKEWRIRMQVQPDNQ